MGQAKRRGTFKKRKTAAIFVDSKIEEQYKGYGETVLKMIKRTKRIRLQNDSAQSPPAEVSQTP